MRVAIVGAGPAGLYLSILLKLSSPGHEVVVLERNPEGAAEGWGVVFWNSLLKALYGFDPDSTASIEMAAEQWTQQTVYVRNSPVSFTGGSGYAIDRRHLLEILMARARNLGVQVAFNHQVADVALLEADLVAACDGVGSKIRSASAQFRTRVQRGENFYAGLGTNQVFRSFTFPFVETDAGFMWAHAYAIDKATSTFIVECSNDTYAGLRLDSMSSAQSLILLEQIFQPHLQGHRLLAGRDSGDEIRWNNFPTVRNERWFDGKTVLLGDAAHTTHFSIGSGTTLALQDAISLAHHLRYQPDVRSALRSYERERKRSIIRLELDARRSQTWFESVDRYANLPPHQFAELLRARKMPFLHALSLTVQYHLYHRTRSVRVLRRAKRIVETTGTLRGRASERFVERPMERLAEDHHDRAA